MNDIARGNYVWINLQELNVTLLKISSVVLTIFFSSSCKTPTSSVTDVYNKTKLLISVQGQSEYSGLTADLYGYYDFQQERFSHLILKRSEGEFHIDMSEFQDRLIFALGIGNGSGTKVNFVRQIRMFLTEEKAKAQPNQKLVDHWERDLSFFKPALEVYEPILNTLTLPLNGQPKIITASRASLASVFQAVAIAYPFMSKLFDDATDLAQFSTSFVGFVTSSQSALMSLNRLQFSQANLHESIEGLEDVMQIPCTKLTSKEIVQNCEKALGSIAATLVKATELSSIQQVH